jgi:serine/threonine protein phosphatase PrpC
LSGDLTLCGVFDGTVGEHAADYARNNIVRVLESLPLYQSLRRRPRSELSDRAVMRPLFTSLLTSLFKALDQAILAHCSLHEYHYSACTAAVALAHYPSETVFISHVADAGAVVAYQPRASDALVGVCVTRPHRPDDPNELERIQRAGGSLVYLHGHKPFLRGGDFHDRPVAMQYNYSRALGGAGLKPYGLSAVPDIRVLEARLHGGSHEDGEDLMAVILGSDGVWDVMSPESASSLVLRGIADFVAHGEATTTPPAPAPAPVPAPPRNPRMTADEARMPFDDRSCPVTPSEVLVSVALDCHQHKKTGDNCSAVVMYFRPRLPRRPKTDDE